ncbi:MAG: glycosyltransferase family 39 protein [Chloroflexi bacterium]|nr:glycosyltransferase family 39 protein [Chloroflexota bacterium]
MTAGRTLAAAGGICGLGFGLCVSTLGSQSLWWDEARTWDLATLPASQIPVQVEANHIATYFVLMHYWVRLAGTTETGLRFTSAACATLGLALSVSLTRALIGRAAALLGGMLAAINPFLLYYGQEARMYMPLLALALLQLRLSLALVRRPQRLLWPSFVAATALALYLHYYGFLVLPVLAVAPLLLGRPLRVAAAHWLALACACVLFVPWLMYRHDLAATYSPITSSTLTLGRLLADYLVATHAGETAFEVRQTLETQPLPWAMACTGLTLVVVGTVAGPGRIRARLLLAAAYVLPLSAVAVLSLGAHRDTTPRYAIAALAGYWPLVGAGLIALNRLTPRTAMSWATPLAAGVFLAAASGWFLQLYLADPLYQRQDFRRAVAYALSRSAGSDITIMVAGYAEATWRYYAGSRMVARSVDDALASPAAVDAAMAQQTNGAERVHLFLWQDYFADPNSLVRGWLDGHFTEVDGRNFREVNVYDYAAEGVFTDKAPAGLRPSGASFSGQLRLAEYGEEPLLEGGVRVTLVWQRLAAVPTAYNVFVHLIDADGQHAVSADHKPGYDTIDLRTWTDARVLVDVYDLPEAVSNPATIEIGVYDPVSGQRLTPPALRLPYPVS